MSKFHGLIVLAVIALSMYYLEFTAEASYNAVFFHLAVILTSYYYYFLYFFEAPSLADAGGEPGFMQVVELPFSMRVSRVSWSAIIPAYFVHGNYLFKPAEEGAHRFPTFLNFPLFWQVALVLGILATIICYIYYKNPNHWPAHRYYCEHPEALHRVRTLLSSETDHHACVSLEHGGMILDGSVFFYCSYWRFIAVRTQDVSFEVVSTRIPKTRYHDQEHRNVFIKATFNKDYLKPLEFCVRHDWFKHFTNKEEVTITIPPHITIPLTVFDELSLELASQIAQKRPIKVRMTEKEPCFGCCGTESFVRIVKSCKNDNNRWQWNKNGVKETTGVCKPCKCKPIWCQNCIAKIYLGNQNIKGRFRADYAKGTAQCPTCRQLFCVRDIYPVVFV